MLSLLPDGPSFGVFMVAALAVEAAAFGVAAVIGAWQIAYDGLRYRGAAL